LDRKLIRIDVVQAALHRLRASDIHSHFAGYLCVKRACQSHPDAPVFSSEFKPFFDTYLAVPGGPPGKPYVRVFTGGNPNGSNWINDNVAGSYAPSSIRPNKPLGQVINVVGERNNATYQLVEDSATVASQHLLNGTRISALDLAIFLYRDFSFDEAAGAAELVEIFAGEFGFSSSIPHQKSDFDKLFHLHDVQMLNTDIFV
jgi:hypothetical protein